jgi:ABC-type branched-subunit amino acid transport system substrate-binding protein
VPRWTLTAGLGGVVIVVAGAVTVRTIGVAVFSIAFFAGQITFDRVLEGEIIVGVLIGDTRSSHAGGAPNSTHLAARLAAANPAASRVRFDVRSVSGQGAAIQRTASALGQSGAQIVIADLDEASSLAAARAGVPVLSLARAVSSHEGLYWAGFNRLEEAAALAREAQSRNLRSLAIVATEDPESQALATALEVVAPQLGLSLSRLPARNANAVLDYISPGEQSVIADAFVFATPAHVAAALVAPVANAGPFPRPIIGNAGWALEQQALQGLPAGWYPTLSSAGLANYRTRFVNAYGAEPSLRSALAYDLMILAAALPTFVENAPYDRPILTNEQGYQGFTGGFRFLASGASAQRSYAIITFQ